MNTKVDRELVELAEQYRSVVPDDFFREVDSLSADLAQNRPLMKMTQKGGKRDQTSSRLKAAILEELSVLLCTDEPRYASVRNDSKKITKDAVHFMAGVIVATVGVTSGVATGGVAFIAIACARVGVGVFCKLNPPPKGATLIRPEGKKTR